MGLMRVIRILSLGRVASLLFSFLAFRCQRGRRRSIRTCPGFCMGREQAWAFIILLRLCPGFLWFICHVELICFHSLLICVRTMLSYVCVECETCELLWISMDFGILDIIYG